MYIPPTVQIAPFVKLRRERILPYPGTVHVNVGDVVEGDTLVASAQGRGKLYYVDVSQKLRLTTEEATKAVLVTKDQEFDKNTTIASHSGLLGAVRVRAPFDGFTVFVLDGRVLLQSDSKRLELKATLPGSVVDSDPAIGVMIETPGAIIQGMWGTGGLVFGELRPLRQGNISVDAFTRELEGTICVAGGTIDAKGLQAAVRFKIGGLVLGSLSSSLLGKLRRVPFPIMVTEGFGQRAMLPDTWQLVLNHGGRDVQLNAQPPDRHKGQRPELLIPLSGGDANPIVPSQGIPLAVDRRVRLVRAPYAAQLGKVVALPKRPMVFESGLRTLAAEVRLDETGETVTVPRLNLEAIEQGTNAATEIETLEYPFDDETGAEL